jgi:hypothetical protein
MIAATTASGQAPRPAQPIVSMGQPPVWEVYAVGAKNVGRSSNDAFGNVAAGLHRPITNPVTGLFGVAGEVSLRVPKQQAFADVHPAARLLATTRVLGLAAGIDFDGSITPLLTIQSPIRRGGLLGHGTMLRFDWYPRRRDVTLGAQIPLRQPFAGRTRPRATDARLPPAERAALAVTPIPHEAETALTRVGYAASQILAYTNLYADDTAAVRYGRSYIDATRTYRDELATAFRAAVNDSPLGIAITARARAGLLDDVIIPYDSLFGQAKKGGIRGLTTAAHGRFLHWLRDSSGVPAARQPVVASVHARWLGLIEAVQGNLFAQWRDSRLVWLPLQLALAEDQYDEQTEVDALVERAVGRPFTDRNALTYLRSSDLPLEIARSIFATRNYHVVWLHDFTGRRAITKEIDQVGFTMVADAYLPALTQAVVRYDSTGQMPVYMILHDEFFYGDNDGRLWLTILEDPLYARI